MTGIGRALVVGVDSRPKAAPLRTPAMSPIISAKPLSLYSPIGRRSPAADLFGSVIGAPLLASTNQPSGIVNPRSAYFLTVP